MKVTKNQLRKIIRGLIREAGGYRDYGEDEIEYTSRAGTLWPEGASQWTQGSREWIIKSPDGQLMKLDGQSLAMLEDPQGNQYTFAERTTIPRSAKYRVMPRTGDNWFETDDIKKLIQWLNDNDITNASGNDRITQ